METYRWLPAEPLEEVALQRLKNHAKKPKQPMGEAWFMSDNRQMYPELLGDFSQMDNEILFKALGEIISGTRSFGKMDEWQTWFPYILSQSIENALTIYQDESLQTLLVTGVMVQNPNDTIDEIYKSYSVDLLNTLGKNLMRRFYFLPNDSLPYLPQSWDFMVACEEVSATLSFCAKYLPTHLIAQWFYSILTIQNPVWKLLIMNWLGGFYELLLTGDWVGKVRENNYPFDITWSWSDCLTRGLSENHADFIIQEKRDAILKTCDNYFTQNSFKYWIKEFGDIDFGYSAYEIQPLMIIQSFQESYINRKNRTVILK